MDEYHAAEGPGYTTWGTAAPNPADEAADARSRSRYGEGDGGGAAAESH